MRYPPDNARYWNHSLATQNIMERSKFRVKLHVLLPIVIIVTAFLWLLPVDAFGIEGLTVIQKRVIALFVFAGLVCYFLSNFISNSATAALLIPILIVVAEGMAKVGVIIGVIGFVFGFFWLTKIFPF